MVFWWGDERFVEPASDDRNARAAREAFLDQVDADPANIHPMPSTESAASVEDGAVATATSCAPTVPVSSTS